VAGKTSKGFGRVWVLFGVLACANVVSAQQAQPRGETAGEGTAAKTGQAEQGEGRDDDPMGGVGLGLKAGYLFFGETEYEQVVPVTLPPDISSQLQKRVQPSRGAPTVGLELFLGNGLGFAWDSEVYLMFDDSLVIGGFMGPAFRFHIKRLYVSLGAGLRVGYLTDDSLDAGLDLYGRIPISLTYYVSDGLGLMFEFGFGWGGTGVKFKEAPVVPGLSPEQQAQFDALASDFNFQFAKTGTFDGAIGLRFP